MEVDIAPPLMPAYIVRASHGTNVAAKRAAERDRKRAAATTHTARLRDARGVDDRRDNVQPATAAKSVKEDAHARDGGSPSDAVAVGETMPPVGRRSIEEHACQWYERALPELEAADK